MKFARFRIVLFARVLKDGKSPVCMRVTFRRKSKYFGLNKQCLAHDFDKKSGRFLRTFPDHRRSNDLLRTWEQRAADVLYSFERDAVPFTFDRFEAAVFGEQSSTGQTAWQYAAETAADLETSGSVGNAEKYLSISAVLRAFKPAATLQDIDHVWLERFERYLRRERGNSDGGTAFTLRTLRALCNRAIKQGKMPVAWYPFRTFKITAPEYSGGARALTREDVRRLETAETVTDRNRFALDMFLLSFYLRGANMADLARLTAENIVGGRVVYVRQKTGKVYSIPVTDKVAAIFSRYTSGVYILPILAPGLSEKQARNRIHVATRTVNSGLREVAAAVGVDAANLSFYSARHTGATLLKREGASVEVISEWLGHSDLKTTRVYLRKFDQSVLDDADRLLE